MLKEPLPNLSKEGEEKRQQKRSQDILLADVHPTPAQYEATVLNSISNDRFNTWTVNTREHYNATGCDCGTGVRFPTGERHFSLLHRTHIVSGARPNSHSMGNRASGQSKWVVKLSTHFHVMQRIKKSWSYSCTPSYAFKAWCWIKHTFVFLEIMHKSGNSVSTIQAKQGGTAGNPDNPNLNSTFLEQDLIPRPPTCE